MVLFKLATLLCFALAPVVGSGQSADPPVPAAGSQTTPTTSSASAEKPAPAPDGGIAAKTEKSTAGLTDAFVIGPEDVLHIRVLHEPDLSGLQDVRPDGRIQLTLIGDIQAAGLTPEALSRNIREKLRETMRNPEVTVQVVKVNSRKYTLHGEVNRPGSYPFATPVTVLDALVNGGGFRDFANPKKIYILRNGQKLPFNYKQVSRGKKMEQNVLVQNGDEIFVP